MSVLTQKASWDWIPAQYDFFQWEPKGRISKEALLGSWGFGKTTGAARKFLKRVSQATSMSEYGGGYPKFAIIAPTYKILFEATLPKFLEACPREWIRKQRGFPSPRIEMANGAQLLLNSCEASLEGLDLAGFWCDEIQHPNFTAHPQRYLNYTARLRDPKARTLSAIVSGLPEAGWVREQFDFPPDDPDSVCIRGGINENPFIPKETAQAMLLACPAGYEQTLLSGEWGMPVGATFPMWNSAEHLYHGKGDPNVPVHLGIDIGNHGAILVAQMVPMERVGITGHKETAMGMLIVDQVLTEFESLEKAVYRFKTETPWQVVPGVSKICVDPTVRKDERLILHRHFPKTHIVIRDRTHDFYSVENGIWHVRSCLKDSLNNVRVQVCSHLERQKFGMVEAVQMARGNAQTGMLLIKDDSRDHPLCALRYLCCELLAPQKAKARVL